MTRPNMMNLTASSAALALALAVSATGVFAQTQLEQTIENTLVEYGYDIDVEMLSRSQLTALTSINEDQSATQIHATIESVLTPEFQAMAADAPQLRAQAEQLFAEYDIDADANTLSLNQLTALTSIDSGSMSETQSRASIQSIVGEKLEMDHVNVLSEGQVVALAQVKLNEYGIDIDASTLSRDALVAVISVDNSDTQTDQQVVMALNTAAAS